MAYFYSAEELNALEEGAAYVSLQGYVGPEYSYYNTYLRNGGTAETFRPVLDEMEALPVARRPVYRGTRLSRFNEWVEGSYFCDPAFLSASSDKKVAVNWKGGPDACVLTIIPKQGRVLGQAGVEGEQEVLFPPGTRFKVVSPPRKEGYKYHAILKEI
jgi:hypothetical protein